MDSEALRFGESNYINNIKMNLINLIEKIETVDEEKIIFLGNKGDFNADIILSYGEDGDHGIKVEDGKEYYYLIEVYLAKEFIKDWVNSLTYVPTPAEISKRLYEYAINDA